MGGLLNCKHSADVMAGGVRHVGYTPTENQTSRLCCSQTEVVTGNVVLQLDFSIADCDHLMLC